MKLLIVDATVEDDDSDGYDDGVIAYNTVRGKLEWKADGKPLGMKKNMKTTGATTDGHGHLFVGDLMLANKCTQMLSASDGQYLRCLMNDVEGLGHPDKICWCAKDFISGCCLFPEWQVGPQSHQYSASIY